MSKKAQLSSKEHNSSSVLKGSSSSHAHAFTKGTSVTPRSTLNTKCPVGVKTGKTTG